MHRKPLEHHLMGFRSRGIHYTRQLVLDRTAEQTEWLVHIYI